jgi:hypothetical protein
MMSNAATARTVTNTTSAAAATQARKKAQQSSNGMPGAPQQAKWPNMKPTGECYQRLLVIGTQQRSPSASAAAAAAAHCTHVHTMLADPTLKLINGNPCKLHCLLLYQMPVLQHVLHHSGANVLKGVQLAVPWLQAHCRIRLPHDQTFNICSCLFSFLLHPADSCKPFDPTVYQHPNVDSFCAKLNSLTDKQLLQLHAQAPPPSSTGGFPLRGCTHRCLLGNSLAVLLARQGKNNMG